MKPSETTALYVEACRSRRLVPQEEEGRQWHKSFSHYEAKDVRAGLDAWTADTTPSKDGTPRGKWLPAPAELVPVIERFLHQRIARAAVPTYYVRWSCSECNHSMSSFLAVGDSSSRPCPRLLGLSGYKCKKPMTIIVDERPKQ